MDFNIEVRKKQLESLDQFISSSQDRVQSVLDFLGWKSSEVLKDNSLIKCSIDPNHQIARRSADEHIAKCSLKKEGYDLKETFLSEPVCDTNYSIAIDDHRKVEIFSEARKKYSHFKTGWNGQDPDPKTSDRLTTTYTSDERLALYDYTIANTNTPEQLPEFDVSVMRPKTDKPLTFKEQLALKRDIKRRSMKYKSVHTSKKNYIEVMREVINGQMELYNEWLKDKETSEEQPQDDAENNFSSSEITTSVHENGTIIDQCSESKMLELDRACSSVSRNSTHSGSSRSTSRRRERDHGHSHKRHKYDYDSREDNHRERHERDRYRKAHYESPHKHSRSQKYDRYKEKERLMNNYPHRN